MAKKYVYCFGGGEAEGHAGMRELLGGKGANLAEMSRIGLPVPAGFTVTTECCVDFFALGERFPASIVQEVDAAMTRTEKRMGMRYGDPDNPLLVSCRSGARSSMPGMMETVLNVGLCSTTVPGLLAKTRNERFVWDAYRRLIMMYSDVVMEKAEGIEPADGCGIRRQLEDIMHAYMRKHGMQRDADLGAEDLRALVDQFRARVKAVLKRPFPDDAREQLWGAIGAVFKSWNGRRAVSFRRIEKIPDMWGTAVTVQSMVFGNMGADSATGVAFTRNPATGENVFYGEWLADAQGEDVVAGTRTPNPLNARTQTGENSKLPSLEAAMPAVYDELCKVRERLERHYKDMQDIEFTIQDGKLYMLQCRSGKRTGPAAVTMAMDMLGEKLIDARTAVLRVSPDHLDQLLHPFLDPAAEKTAQRVARGLPAGPGAAAGRLAFDSRAAVAAADRGESVLLVREETNPEDIEGMRAAVGILTARGGMTSHAALVARGWGKCCVVGCSALQINAAARTLTVDGKVYREKDVLTLNGTRGYVYAGAVPMVSAAENPAFVKFMRLADRFRRLGIRANADTPEDARVARDFGAEGIGLFRTEHMFYGADSAEPLFALRKLILSHDQDERGRALDELFIHVKRDIKATLKAMAGLPVTLRLLDPPLHEFMPAGREAQEQLARALGITAREVRRRGQLLHENNPMMGHRGVRLGITQPAITRMQVRAIFEAAAELKDEGTRCQPEIMVPVTCDPAELRHQKAIIEAVHAEVCRGLKRRRIPHRVGTMIEIPRACLQARGMAADADFFSFGTNDLTQMTFGFSRDDMGGFLPVYLDQGILPADPFQTLDGDGVGVLIRMAVEHGRETRPDLKVGICGEHGGDPESIRFCHRAGLSYVSCSPYRVPIARLAAAQAAITDET